MGATTIEPGEEGAFSISHVMGRQMGFPHIFEFTVKSNDPVEPEKKVTLQIDYVLAAEEGEAQ